MFKYHKDIIKWVDIYTIPIYDREESIKFYEEHKNDCTRISYTEIDMKLIHQRFGDVKFLNEPFIESEGHHLDDKTVVFLPKPFHVGGHNRKTGRNMQILECYSYFFLMQQNIKDIQKE